MHSAFTFAYESQLAKTSVINTDLPPGALISFIQKGLQYVGIEAHINEVRGPHDINNNKKSIATASGGDEQAC